MPWQLSGNGRSGWSTKLIRGLKAEAAAGFQSRRKRCRESTPVTPQYAAFPTYKAARVHSGRNRKDDKLTSWSASQATHALRGQLAQMFALPPETSARGDGPLFRKVGHSIRYSRGVLVEWTNSQLRSSTSERT
jgi:hypothetical protein